MSLLTNSPHNTQPLADEQSSALDEALRTFARPPIVGEAKSATQGLALGTVVEPEEAEDAEVDAEESTEDTTNEQPDTTEFATQFESYFGVKPEEALDVVNQLVAMRDEQQIMRTWKVSPVEYDERMSQVKEFFQTLPEEGQQQFNTVEGALAIWEHLQKNGSTTDKSTPTVAKVSKVKQQQAKRNQKPILKKAEILKMSETEYLKRLPEITAAFREGRVV
jgi:hypothetical protein